jgi:hypothetical protein
MQNAPQQEYNILVWKVHKQYSFTHSALLPTCQNEQRLTQKKIQRGSFLSVLYTLS